MAGKSTKSNHNFLQLLAFIGVIAVGVALVLSFVFNQITWTHGQNLANALTIIAQAIAYIIIAYLSFFFARRNGWIFILVWAIAVTLIVVFIIL